MRKRFLSLALALALCLSLCVPAFAADGTTKVVEDTKVRVTIEGFLREEYYGLDRVYVVTDDAKITFSLKDGVDDPEIGIWGWSIDSEAGTLLLAACGDIFYGDGWPAEGVAFPVSDRQYIYTLHGGKRFIPMCESDFAKLKPSTTEPLASDWAKKTILAAYNDSLVGDICEYESDDDFRIISELRDLTRGITRAEFTQVVMRLYWSLIGENPNTVMGSTQPWDLPFTDIDTSGSSSTYHVYEAYNLGFVNGTSATTFSPDATLTREQAATMLARVYAKVYGDIPTVTKTSFADDASVASWAKSGVAFMADKGIIKGMGNNKFAPQTTLSIEQAVVMAYRMLQAAQQ